jgi:hypothetical protein
LGYNGLRRLANRLRWSASSVAALRVSELEQRKEAMRYTRPLLPLEDRPYRAGQSPHWIKVKEPRAPRYEARDGVFLMLVYCAKNCETIVEAEIIDLGAGAGRIRCLECGGDGDWSRFAPDMMPPGMMCLDCKGSGYQLVSI